MRKVSSLYRTSPVGMRGRQPWFGNAAAMISSSRPPESLLRLFRAIEAGLGRRRRGGARTVDLDLLACGSELVARGGTIVPHPRMHERAFVLVPLAELDRRAAHPALGVSYGSLLAGLDTDEKVVRLPAAVQRRFRRLAGGGVPSSGFRVPGRTRASRNSKLGTRDSGGR